MQNFNDDIKNRTKKISIRVIKMYSLLEKNEIIRIIGKQFLRSSTSIAANFRAACRARSTKEYYSKLCICVEESDETLFQFEILVEANLIKEERIKDLMIEATEILKILASTKKRTKQKLEKLKS